MAKSEPESLDTPAMKKAQAEEWTSEPLPAAPLDAYAEEQERIRQESLPGPPPPSTVPPPPESLDPSGTLLEERTPDQEEP